MWWGGRLEERQYTVRGGLDYEIYGEVEKWGLMVDQRRVERYVRGWGLTDRSENECWQDDIKCWWCMGTGIPRKILGEGVHWERRKRGEGRRRYRAVGISRINIIILTLMLGQWHLIETDQCVTCYFLQWTTKLISSSHSKAHARSMVIYLQHISV